MADRDTGPRGRGEPIQSRDGQVIAVLEPAFPRDEPGADAAVGGPDVHGVCEVERALLARSGVKTRPRTLPCRRPSASWRGVGGRGCVDDFHPASSQHWTSQWPGMAIAVTP